MRVPRRDGSEPRLPPVGGQADNATIHAVRVAIQAIIQEGISQ